jgi:hypothetical protein
MMRDDQKGVGGVKEGVARGISQACVYVLEAQKSAAQVGIPSVRAANIGSLIKGMMESAITSGVIFGMYFSAYNSFHPSDPWAGPAATFITSLVKIPISNGMRLRQVGRAPNLIGATKKIVKMQGLRGLYNGYTLSVIEDMIEFDMRIRLYNGLKQQMGYDKKNNIVAGIGLGAIAGMVASYITSPFDMIRANMTVQQKPSLQCIREIFNRNGVLGFYQGAHLRMLSNGAKYALFFMIFECL